MQPQRDRRLSAMLRVKDEQAFLEAAVASILDLVDEIVLVDNRSSDSTPNIIAQLQRERPDVIVPLEYPHEVRRVGRETRELARASSSSPELSAVFYNWCLDRCRFPYVLKWDGDMLALDRLAGEIAAWRSSDAEFLCVRGANLHPNRQNLAAARTRDPEALRHGLSERDVLPEWVTDLTYDSLEPRLFPREKCEYRSDAGWTQRLWSSLLEEPSSRFVRTVERPCFLHLKLCKPDPFSNYTRELAEVIASNVAVGPPLAGELRQVLERSGLAAP